MPPATTVAPSAEVTELTTQVREAVRAAAAPVTLAEVKETLTAAGVPLPGKPKVIDARIQRELDAEGVYTHPAGTAKGKPKYWHRPPPTVAERVEATVRAKLDALGHAAATPSQLGKPGGKSATPEAARAFDAILARFLGEGKLFRQGAKYTTQEPPRPKWHESSAHRAEYKKLAAAVAKLVGTGAVTLDQIVAALREKFGATLPDAPPPPVAPPVPGADAPELGAALRAAYDHLCKFVEFRDRLVELPRLYHEARKRLPALTVEAFHGELSRLSRAYLVELHVLNEVRTAEEPHLAILRDGRLYYYARWK